MSQHDDFLYVCDKCSKPVHKSNDVATIQFILTNDWSLVGAEPRHFLPTEGCEGSPSRAQYIKGQPRDSRSFHYNPEDEAKWRSAYAEAQRKYPVTKA